MGEHSLATNHLKQAVSIFSKPKVKKFKSTKIYVTYLDTLLRWWKNGRMDSLAVIGESHCLAIHRTKLKFNQHAYQSQAYWIAGIKMWHLAQTPNHPMKHKIQQLLPNIAITTLLLLTIGEIDCRFNEGIWVAAKKQNFHCSVLIEKNHHRLFGLAGNAV